MRRYHGRDLRKGRFSQSYRPYLVTTVTRDRTPLFADFQVGRLVVAELRKATFQGYADTLAWIVMPDHLHWLMTPVSESLSNVVRRVKSASAININRRLGTDGSRWQKGFHDRGIRRDEDVQAVARYIIANPLRAGLVDDIGRYPLWDAVWL